MADAEQGNLEPPVRKSIDDPGAHDLGKDLQSLQKRPASFNTNLIYF
jgi:hypothetical protein